MSGPQQLPPARAAPAPASPPPPPPLPPPRLPPPRFREGPTNTSAVIRAATTADRPSTCLDNLAPSPFQPVYYFFYGTLMKPDILKGVLGLDLDPVLRSAKIYGFELANWGQYRTLADSHPDAVVAGCAYLVQSAEDERKLVYYETNAYTVAACKIRLTYGTEDQVVEGKAFKYAGDPEALKAGRFDRTLWERRTGH